MARLQLGSFLIGLVTIGLNSNCTLPLMINWKLQAVKQHLDDHVGAELDTSRVAKTTLLELQRRGVRRQHDGCDRKVEEPNLWSRLRAPRHTRAAVARETPTPIETAVGQPQDSSRLGPRATRATGAFAKGARRRELGKAGSKREVSRHAEDGEGEEGRGGPGGENALAGGQNTSWGFLLCL